MVLKVAAPSSLQHWSQPYSVPQSPSSSQALVSAISSPSSSSKRRCFSLCRSNRSALFAGQQSSGLYKSGSCHDLQSSGVRKTIRRALSSSLDFFPDEEFSKEIQELDLSFLNSDEDGSNKSNCEGQKNSKDESFEARFEEHCGGSSGEVKFFDTNTKPFSHLDAPDSHDRYDIERKANSFNIPLSLRIIKRKRQWQDELIEVGESAYCSMKKAFSSMVYIIRELHSYSLQMREVLFYEDLQGILSSVQKEMHASFVWLFQKIFSQTPTLMVYLMILLANYSVYSMSNNAAKALTAPPPAQVSTTTTMEVEDQGHDAKHNFDSSVVKTFKLSSSSGKTASVGGDGGGGKCKPIASGTNGDGRFNDESKNYYKTIIAPDSTVPREVSDEEEMKLRDTMVDEASEMQSEPLEHETIRRFVSPIDAKIEADDQYANTELVYQMGLAQEPENPLLLANYAQFLYLTAHDYDSAEEYFKRAVKIEPKDAEAFNKYAKFLWLVRKDLWAAEETYLEAIDVEPENSYYAANYAHFLWNTGGEDTCFPLNTNDV